jgi:hypothetical protein
VSVDGWKELGGGEVSNGVVVGAMLFTFNLDFEGFRDVGLGFIRWRFALFVFSSAKERFELDSSLS